MGRFRQQRDRGSLGDSEDFARFYAAHSQAVLVFIARRVLEPAVALDLTAEAFAQAFERRSRFRGSSEEQAAAWIFAIARGLLSHYYRRGVIERRTLDRLPIDVPELSSSDIERVEELAGLAPLRRATQNGMEELSDAERDAIRLRIVEELPYADVAARLGISDAAARTRVSRGLRALAEALGDLEGELDGS